MPLYVIATPIGNPDDLTLRAAKLLQSSDLWIVEERKPARQLAKSLGVFKDMVQLNEHNEADEAAELIKSLKAGESLSLITDCGTPGFADPGAKLVALCHHHKVPVIPVPGASSLTAALSVSGLRLKEFFYAGFLPRNSEERRKSIRSWQSLKVPVVVYEAPYRIKPLVADLLEELPDDRGVRVFLALTQPEEKIFVGHLKGLDNWLGQAPPKLEFVMIVEPAPKALPGKGKAKVRTKRT